MLNKIKPYFKDVSQMIAKSYKNHNLLYDGFGILTDGKVVYNEYNGYIDCHRNIPFSIDTVFNCGSLTKHIIAISILQLRDKQLLHLDDSIFKFIPNLKIESYTKDSADITISHLLQMFAGIEDNLKFTDYKIITDDTILTRKIYKIYESGTHYLYSGIQYDLLGIVITKVSEINYQKYITLNILIPLQMNNTTFDLNIINKNLLNQQYILDSNNNITKLNYYETRKNNEGASIGLYTSMRDWFKIVLFNQSAYTTNNLYSNILTKSSIREIHNPFNFASIYFSNKKIKSVFDKNKLNILFRLYSYGVISEYDENNINYIGHNGLGLGSSNIVWGICPKYNLGIVMTTSGQNLDDLFLNKLNVINADVLRFLIYKSQTLTKQPLNFHINKKLIIICSITILLIIIWNGEWGVRPIREIR